MMKDKKIQKGYPLSSLAWTRNGGGTVSGEQLILATLLHTTGDNRDGSDFKVIQKMMNDPNLDKE